MTDGAGVSFWLRAFSLALGSTVGHLSQSGPGVKAVTRRAPYGLVGATVTVEVCPEGQVRQPRGRLPLGPEAAHASGCAPKGGSDAMGGLGAGLDRGL